MRWCCARRLYYVVSLVMCMSTKFLPGAGVLLPSASRSVQLTAGRQQLQEITMPMLEVATNIPKEKVTPDVLTSLSKLLSEILGKSEQYCMVRIVPDQLMTFGGTTEPCGAATLCSLGKLGVEENKAYAAKIYAHLEKTLGIPSDRMYIKFQDLETSNTGYKGTTFHEILGR